MFQIDCHISLANTEKNFWCSAFGRWRLLYHPELWRHAWHICFVYICLGQSWNDLVWYFGFRLKFETLVSATDKVITQCIEFGKMFNGENETWQLIVTDFAIIKPHCCAQNKTRPIVTDVAWSVCLCVFVWAVLKWLNRSRCCLGCGFLAPEELCIRWGSESPRKGAVLGMSASLSVVSMLSIIHMWQQLCGQSLPILRKECRFIAVILFFLSLCRCVACWQCWWRNTARRHGTAAAAAADQAEDLCY